MKAEAHSHECPGNATPGGAAGSKNRRATHSHLLFWVSSPSRKLVGWEGNGYQDRHSGDKESPSLQVSPFLFL